MHSTAARVRWRPNMATLVASVMIVGGLLLTGVSWWFLLLSAAGAFGPGFLREMGWLDDQDEFQRRAAQRAAHHAYLATGLVAFALIAYLRTGDRSVADVHDVPTLLVAVLWFTWLLSSLIGYWGAPIAARRILGLFGVVWLAFAVLSNTGPEWAGPVALVMQSALALPFFVLAWMAGRAPRVTGLLLLVTAAFFFQLFGMFRNDNLSLMTQGVTFVLFVGPLLASGIALAAPARD